MQYTRRNTGMRWRSALAALLLACTGAASAAGGYLLGDGDVVRINVFENPNLATVARISAGRINFPLVGSVQLQGLTEREAEARLADALEKGGFVRSPQVTLLVEQYRSREVAVLGLVNRPGKYPLEVDASLVDMLAMAGGIHPEGSERVLLVRRGADGTVTRTPVDVRGLVTEGDLSLNPALAAGDVVYVPPIEMFYVYGEVQRPGSFRLDRPMTVMQALAVAGSLSPRGTKRGITIQRRDASGEQHELKVQLNDPVLPNDVVSVREALF